MEVPIMGSEFTGSGDSPLTHYIENLVREQDGLNDAAQGVFSESGVDSIGGLLKRYGDCHRQWFQRARQEMIDGGSNTAERQWLHDSLVAQDELLKVAFGFSDGDDSRVQLDAAIAAAGGATAKLLPLAKVDVSDTKADTARKIAPKDVNEVARYIRAHREMERNGKAPHKSKRDLIIEAVGKASYSAMERKLTRYKDSFPPLD
jgi:hypothetical protein